MKRFVTTASVFCHHGRFDLYRTRQGSHDQLQDIQTQDPPDQRQAHQAQDAVGVHAGDRADMRLIHQSQVFLCEFWAMEADISSGT